jgi:CDP-6-deoxy-D-xylo-4-hexulose-3-dehydrase
VTSPADGIRDEIRRLVRSYHEVAFPASEFVPGVTPVPYAGRVFDAEELVNLVDAGLDFWLTAGPYATRFEKAFSQIFGLRSAVLVNSGSSANLLAVSALTSPRLDDPAARRRLPPRLLPGDEVLTVAAGFPTTVNPAVQNRLTPVFVDVALPTYNVDVGQLEAAIGPRTRAIMLAHALGNPFDLDAVTEIAKRHNLWLVEDCCDALGSTYHGRPVGSFGHLATVSFFPAHHITMGEGGCVVTDDPLLKTLLESFRDWGRDCWCLPGEANTCGKRFDWCLGQLPRGYDHKYTYSHVGYNLKLTDVQAAIGLAQLDKLPAFIAARRANFEMLREQLADLEEFLILPEATPGSAPSWFGFPLAIRAGAPFDRPELIDAMESRKIATRLLFGGNLTRQPAYEGVEFRQVGDLPVSDFVMNNVFWLGVFPGLTPPMLDHMATTLVDFVRSH